MNLKNIAVFILLSATLSLQAQKIKKDSIAQTTLITDRPDATESPNSLPTGFCQYEGGFLYSKDKGESKGIEKTVYNTGLFRIGIIDNLELRLGYNVINERQEFLDVTLRSIKSSGLDPMLFGFKTTIRQGKDGKADLGFMGHIYLPFTASKDFRPQTTAVDFRFSISHVLGAHSNIAYNIGAQWPADLSEMAYLYTLAYGLSLSDKWGVYLEVYGDLPENNASKHYWDTGFTYLLNNYIQLDATVGSGITTDQAILFSTGLSVRLPR